MKYSIICLAAAVLVPVSAQAEFNTSGSLYLGYGNVAAGGEEGGIGILSLQVDGKHQLSEAVELTLKGNLYGRTNQDDLPLVRDEPYDLELGLDFGAGGKLRFTTYGRCDAKAPPWVEGDLGNRGSIGVHPAVAPKFRCVGGNVPIFNAGPLVADTNAYFAYDYHNGPFGLELYYNPFLSYDRWSGDDAHTVVGMTVPGDGDLPPQGEIVLSYATKPAILFAGSNDLGDWFGRAVIPVPAADLAVIYTHQYQNVSDNQHSDAFVLDWKPKDMGVFKGLFGLYVQDQTKDNLVLSANFGGDSWSFGFGADLDGDVAIEGGYKFNDNLEFVFGADNGFETNDGFDFAGFPPPFAEGRGSAFELGVRMTF